MPRKFHLSLFFIIALILSACSSNDDTKLTDNPDVQQFIQEMTDKHKFDPKELNELFTKVKVRPEVIVSMETPYEAKPWYIYKKHFVSQERIDRGVEFWKTNQELLTRAEKVYGVPQKMIVAIIGVESLYGQHKGKYSVLDTLSTLAFDYPRRAPFFRKELEEFLLLCREQNWQPGLVLGSYAGAVGQPQFMPSSYRAYAVDFTRNGSIDLFDNIGDVIGSVASYFHAHGWQEPAPIVVQAKTTNSQYVDALSVNRNFKPTMTLAQFAQHGIYPQGPHLPSHLKAVLFKIETAPNQFQYWLAFNNFYVITRYNTSSLYALAVSQLATQVEIAHKKQLAQAKAAAKAVKKS